MSGLANLGLVLGVRLRAAVALGLVAVAVLALAADAPAADPKPVKYDYVLLIDTSSSMRGEGSGNPENIFPRVKRSVKEFIGSLELGNTTVYVYPFDVSLGRGKVFPLRSQEDKRRAKAYVDGLVADGSLTAIYDSLDKVLREMKKARAARPGSTRVQTILLFTDGKDTSGRATLPQILREFELARGENPYLYLKYVTLGVEADRAWDKTPGVDVVRTPSGEMPKLRSARVLPMRLDFGSFTAVDRSTRTIEISFDPELEGTALTLAGGSASTEAAGGLVSVEPGSVKLQGSGESSTTPTMRQEVTLVVENRESLTDDDPYSGQIRLAIDSEDLVAISPTSLAFTFTMAVEPEVSIQSGSEPLEAALGPADPYTDGEKTITLTRQIDAAFNESAAASGATVEVGVSRVSGPAEASVVLVGAEGPAATVRLTPENPACTLEVQVPPGQAAGDYSYELAIEPGAGVSLTGLAVDPESGLAVVPVTFSVPEAPTPLWQTVVRWVVIAAIALLVLLAIAFLALCFITGTGPVTLAKLLVRRLRPKMLDAHIVITAPAEAEDGHDLSDKRHFDVGPGRGLKGLDDLPCTVRFEAQVSVLEASDDIAVSIVADGAGDGTTYLLSIKRPFSEEPESRTRATIGSGDVVSLHVGDAQRLEIIFSSTKYCSA